jgi:hypothetical protein
MLFGATLFFFFFSFLWVIKNILKKIKKIKNYKLVADPMTTSRKDHSKHDREPTYKSHGSSTKNFLRPRTYIKNLSNTYPH